MPIKKKLDPGYTASELRDKYADENKWKMMNLNVEDKDMKIKNKRDNIVMKIDELKRMIILCKTEKCKTALSTEIQNLIQKYSSMPGASNWPPLQ